VTEVHNTCRTFIARNGLGFLVGGIYVHLTASGAGSR
jgi:hypothetical protein